MAATDKLRLASNGTQAVPTSLASAMAYGATTATLNVATGWPTATGVDVVMYLQDTAGVKVAGSQTAWVFQLTGTTLSGGVLKSGTMPATGYPSGSSTVVTVRPTAAWGNDVINSLLGIMNQDGSLKTAPIQTALGLGASSLNGWNALGYAPSTVTAYGNRSYNLTFNGVDLTGTLSAGMRLRTTRTVPAPTQCTSLNGTTQYFSKSSPAGMTFTNNFVVSAWIKLASYPALSSDIFSRFNGTNGWRFIVDSSGTVSLLGYNAASASYAKVNSYQSIPLNKWVHVAAQLDMTSTTTTGGTVNYIMIDGVDVPANFTRSGTAPTALVQAGNLEIGSNNGGLNPFAGKIAQAAIYSAKVTQATIQGTISQGLLGTEANLISAYSFNASTSDLNTTNANNLTANGSAVATATDSPFGNTGKSSTLDYAIISADPVFSTNTTVVVQVPEGCTIPTSGGVASVVYSSNAYPYGLPSHDSVSRYTRTVQNTSAPTLTSSDQDLRGCGLLQTLTTFGGATAQVRVDLAITSTSDFEFKPEIWLNGSFYKGGTPGAALTSAGNRATERGYTFEVILPDGTNTLSAGVTLTSGAGYSMIPGSSALTVSIVRGIGTGN